jgi:D-lactate dehydrogenase
MRKGFIPMFGATRPKGTTMLTEDVAGPVERLADFVIDMRKLLDEYGYEDAIIFGHALAGNLHFQMSDNFMAPGAAEKFDRFSKALADFVSIRYGGSLKAEHGTGRAIAAFVEAEWGKKAYRLMHRIKGLFDPEGLLNPGVLLNPDPQIHAKNLKLMPLADPVVDLCIECGFCEPACPATHLTLSPRQRIVVTRERARLRMTGEDPQRLAALERDFGYAGLQTCAAGNVCAERCPVGIETGTMVLGERARRRTKGDRRVAHFVASHTGAAERAMDLGIGAGALSRRVVGDKVTDAVTGVLRRVSAERTPRLSPALRSGPAVPRSGPAVSEAPRGRIVYFPSCATRMFGAPSGENALLDTPAAMLALLRRAGFTPVVPKNLTGQCCGQPFESKGFPDEAERVGRRLGTELNALSGNGRFPVVTDASTCAKHMRAHGGVALDSSEFIAREVLPHLTITRKVPVVAVHHNCSAQRLKEQAATEEIARATADRVVVLSSFQCCGYAGDKGLFQPELNAWALRFVKSEIPADCRIGISTVATCATGLSERAGIPFVSVASLLESVTQPAS